MKTKLIKILVLVVAVESYCLYWQKAELDICDRHIEAQQDYIFRLENYVPTVFDLQERLGVEQDGILGPVTIQAWDERTVRQFEDSYSYDFNDCDVDELVAKAIERMEK
jgi:hypothetical protein